MTRAQLTYCLSAPRFHVYLKQADNDIDKACTLYKANMELSGAFYPMLSVVEVSLRNAINETLKAYFGDEYWFSNKLPADFSPYITEAVQKLKSQRKNITADRIIAELNFGFWNRLFNRYYASRLWKPLRLVFKNMPKPQRQRDTIADTLYRIRRLRNRIYHYEPIFANPDDLENRYEEMYRLPGWLDKDLPQLLTGIDHFHSILKRTKAI